MEISDSDVRIKETSSLSCSQSSEKSRFLASEPKQDPGNGTRNKNNLLRSQSVYTPKVVPSATVSRSPLPKQASPSVPSNESEDSSSGKARASPEPMEPEPVLTLASSFTDKTHVTFGFDVPRDKKD